MKTVTIVAGVLLVFVFVWERVDVVRLGYHIERLKTQKIARAGAGSIASQVFCADGSGTDREGGDRKAGADSAAARTSLDRTSARRGSGLNPPVEQFRLAKHVQLGGRASDGPFSWPALCDAAPASLWVQHHFISAGHAPGASSSRTHGEGGSATSKDRILRRSQRHGVGSARQSARDECGGALDIRRPDVARESIDRRPSLSPVLHIRSEEIEKKLRQDKRFVWLARKVEPEQGRRLEQLSLDGIGMVMEGRRFYPKGPYSRTSLDFRNGWART